jgi:hypothetical protein
MVNFPGSLDALANPGATTKRDATGFEHHLQHSDVNDIVEALMAKLGIGATTPDANEVLVGTGAGASAWLAGLTADYIAANAVTQSAGATGAASGPTTTSASLVDLTDMSVTMTLTGGPIIVEFSSTISLSAIGIVAVDLLVDGVNVLRRQASFAAAETKIMGFTKRVTGVSGASKVIKVQWLTTAGTASAITTQRDLVVTELKR